MNLKKLSDEELVEHTHKLVREERETLTKILRNFREIEVRRLYASEEYRCPSLHEFVIKVFKYPEDQAGRRISAMRLLRELPEIEHKIETGALSLTNLCLARTFFRKEKPSRQNKIELLTKIENISTREAARIIRGVSKDPVALERDFIRDLGDDYYKFEFTGDAELKSLLDQAKGLLAHAHGDLSMNELLKLLAKNTIEKVSPRRKRRSPAAPRAKGGRRQPSSADEAAVWERADGRCENCGSVHKLEIDHLKPWAAGGTSDPENLRLLCRNCNERAAIETLGLKKMRPFFDRDVSAPSSRDPSP